jgi:putative ABC transport system substrate-binding protein
MERREIIRLLAGSALAWPLMARAQRTTPAIGFLGMASAGGYRPLVNAFRQGLQESGYLEGRDVAIEYRWAEDRVDQLSPMAAELVRSQVSVIVAATTAAALAAKAATTTIPIVFEMAGDPVTSGSSPALTDPAETSPASLI